MIIQPELEQKLRAGFAPTYLELVNESHMHAAPPRSTSGRENRVRETHFKAVIVSDAFNNKRLVQQHQAVYAALGESMGKIHALALHTYTPAQWYEQWQKQGMAPASPECLGGSKHDH